MNTHRKIITDIKVRFRDIDSMGHVNNAVFFTYFEEGRKEFLHKLFSIVNPKEYNYILAHIRCDYLKPVKLDDTISLQLWVSEISKKRFNLKYRLVNKGNESIVYAEGQSVQVCFDYKKNSTIPITNDFLEKISEYIG